MAEQTIRTYLLLTLLTRLGISFTFATFTVFLLARGLNFFEVNLVNGVFFGSIFLLEIPTGAVADVFGRKPSFVLSCFFLALGMTVYAFSYSIWEFAIAEILVALGYTLSSGAFQAWLVDGLHYYHYQAENFLQKIFSKEQQISYGAACVGAITGALSADADLMFPWIAGACTMIVAGILAMVLMKEEYFVRKQLRLGMIQSLKETMFASVRYSTSNNAIKFIIVLSMAQAFAVQAPDMQWQPVFLQFFQSKTALGFLWVGIMFAMLIGARIAPRIPKNKWGEEKTLALSQIIIGVGIIGSIITNVFPITLSAFLLHEVARGVFQPLKDAYLNANIPSQERATLLSMQSAQYSLAAMFGLLISGLVAEYSSISVAWTFSGIVIILISSILLLGKIQGRN